MARATARRTLVVWLNGAPVARWEIGRVHTLQYFPEWLESAERRPLSLSLPFRPDNGAYQGDIVEHYFDNLLPDSERIRRRIATHFHTEGIAPHQLLAAVGRDCVGAIQLLPEGEEPSGLFTIQGEPMGETAVAELLRATVSDGPMGQRDEDADLRLSIAGAQEKSALLWHEGAWQRPIESTPTTHIFKLPLGRVGAMQADMRTSLENEWLCSRVMAAFALPVAQCRITQFEDIKTLVVERFDRRLARDNSWIVRLPQEDFCQALGVSPQAKYEADGGPGIEDVMTVLAGSDEALADRQNFFKTQLVFWLLAATDGHAKNFSIFHLPQSRFHATPLYDVLSAHPIIGNGPNQLAPQRAKLAMAIRGRNAHYRMHDVQRRHWTAQALRAGLGPAFAENLIEELVQEVPRVVDSVQAQLPDGFPADLADSILQGLLHQAQRLNAMPPA